MDILKDPKKLPIIIAVVVVALIAAVGSGLYFSGVFGGDSSGAPAVVTSSSTTAPPPGANGPPSGQTNGPNGPGPAGASPAPATVAAAGATPPGGPGGNPQAFGSHRTPGAGKHGRVMMAMNAGHAGKVIGSKPKSHRSNKHIASSSGASGSSSNPAFGPDPFYVEPAKKEDTGSTGVKTANVPVLPPLPTDIPAYNPDQNKNDVAPPPPVVDDAKRRVDGILRSSDGVFAVLETNGVARTVQPGDNVDGALVLSIDQDGVTLKTENNQTIHVPISDTAG